ncbi:MAG: hypothetical protein ACREFT_16855, partial [Acetobacteraceae bacterium]
MNEGTEPVRIEALGRISWREWLLTDAPTSRRQSIWAEYYRAWRRLAANRLAFGGLIVVLALAFMALAAPWLAPYN